ncbi:MAG: hypothetical protein RLZZ490_17 [Cyanobacteriota bacterium]
MGNIQSSKESDTVSVHAQYDALSPLGKEMIRLLAIAYAGVTQTFLVDCLREIKTELGLPLQPGLEVHFKAMLTQLLESGLIKKGKQSRWVCHELLRDIPCREAVKSGRYDQLADLVSKHEEIKTMGYSDRRNFPSEDYFIREVRIGIYRQDLEFIEQQFQDYYHFSSRPRLSFSDILLKTINNPFDSEWLSGLQPKFLSIALTDLMDQSLERLSPADESFEILKEFALEKVESPIGEEILVALLTAQDQFFFRGELDDLKRLIKRLETNGKDLHPCYSFIIQASVALLQGQYAEAIANYETALKGIRRLTGKRKIYFSDLSGILCLFALIGEGSPQSLTKAQDFIKIALKAGHYVGVYNLFDSVVDWLNGDRNARTYLENHCDFSPGEISIESFVKLLIHHWLQKESSSPWLAEAKSFYQDAFRADYQWFAMTIADLLGRYESENKTIYETMATEWQEKTGIVSVLDIIKPQSEWELSLQALANLTNTRTTTTTHAAVTGANKRLAWFVTYYSPENVHLSPKEQSLSKKGEWTAGRAIAMKRLSRRSADVDYLSPQDERVCGHIETYSYGYYGQVDYQFNDKALVELIGHPLVFWEDNPNIPIDIVAGEPQLQIKKTGNKKLVIKLEPRISSESDVIAIKESLTRLKVIAVTPEHRRIATILGNKNRLEVPIAAQEKVMNAINAVASLVTVHSDIGGGLDNVESLPAHSLPHFHLLPLEGGLRIALLTRPFGDVGPYFQPGKGGETVITEIDGKRYQTTRNLSAEKQQAKSVIKACPTLFINDSDGGEWYLDDPENCLELLLELQELGDQARVEWPEGEKMRVSSPAGFGQFKLNINRQRDWFAAEGELQVDDNLVVGLQQLMELLENSPGRFVPLADGQFLALTNEFRQRLEELKAYSEKYGDGRRFHPLAALALEDFLDEAEQVKADRHWKEHLKKIKEMKDLDPQLPSTLQADLRDYQREGFQWLARLAHWGVGACLADDMGLGKTLQALALILTKAAAGPTLIVAPTSVCPNWISEAHRFAPTLNPFQFGSGDRAATLDNLKPFDLVVCTYGLLQQEDVAELLAKVQWQIVVLDEAQAIKNMATKRSQAAMNLQAEFKLMTTGTPIENHLGELWNLFRFINPGLLGSLESFNQRFANPIERDNNKAARQQLKRLIQPFLLRRTKNQVLTELPARTEILIQVELSQEEIAFYEALRRQAIAKLEESDAQAGAKHLQVLAEIMRLRRACCNPSLILPDTPIKSSKLETFGEILQELLDNNHKALVFSQCVDHLTIIRNYLDQQKIHYQYLDGSTPIKERKKRVDAFQNGEGDVFLISLKAGGTGLNLTAADYVIHMDPWWNPAVEDQASDRAHRIGQKRPVTIYRLVAKQTIEEKIVDLHHQKRDLADSLLEGTDVSGKVSTEQLLGLISGQ